MKKFSFYIEPFAPAGMFFLFCCCEDILRTAMICAVAAHEAGHLISALFCGIRVRGLRLGACGISLSFSAPKNYKEEFFLAAGGPVFSFALCAVAALRGGEFGANTAVFSAFLGAVNLLPLPTFDGSRMCSSMLSFFLGTDRAGKAVNTLSMVCLLFAWVIAVYILFYSGANFALLLFCSYIFVFAVMKKEAHFAS